MLYSSTSGLPYNMGQFQGPATNVPVQNQLPSSNQSNVLQLLQAALTNQASQGVLHNPAVNSHSSGQLGNFLGNPAPSAPSNTNLNALGLLSSLAGISQQSTSSAQQETGSSQLNQNAAITSLSVSSNPNPGFSPYDDTYASSSQTSSAYGPVRAPARSDPKSTTYRPY